MSTLLKGNLDYKVKIDAPNVIELISETFDNVLNYMLPEMLVFGGALRDIIAGFGLHHDLDIATSRSEGKEFIHHLETSSKWIEECVITQYKKQAKAMEDNISNIISPHSMENGMLDLNRIFSDNIRSKPSGYSNILGVRTFVNSSGHKLQIIISKSDLFTLKETPPINIVKTVDFICCGLIMDIDGNVYEVIEGARNDCIERVLRINKNADIKLCNLNKRIKKLTVRGWKSQIDLTRIKHKQVRLEETIRRRTKRLEKRQSKSSIDYIHEHILQNGKMQLTINTSKMRIFGYCRNSSTRTLDMFYNMLKEYHLTKEAYNCQISVSYNKDNHIIISVCNKNAGIMSIFKRTLLYLEHKFLPNQKHEANTKSRKSSEEMLEPIDQPYHYNGKIFHTKVRVHSKDCGIGGHKIDPNMYGFTYGTGTTSSMPITSVEIAEESTEISEEMEVKAKKAPLLKGSLILNGGKISDGWEYMAGESITISKREPKPGIVVPKKKSAKEELNASLRTIFRKGSSEIRENPAKPGMSEKKLANTLKMYGDPALSKSVDFDRYFTLNDEITSEPLLDNDKVQRCNDLKTAKKEKIESVKTPPEIKLVAEAIEEEKEERMAGHSVRDNKADKAISSRCLSSDLEYGTTYSGQRKI